MRKKRQAIGTGEAGNAGRIGTAIARHPREFVGIVMATLACFAIFSNALFMQKGPHPAPIFASRPLLKQTVPLALPRPQPVQAAPTNAGADAATQKRAQLTSDIQRELARRGFYDGPIDGVWGARTDGAARDFTDAARVRVNVEASDALLRAIAGSRVKRVAPEPARANDPIAELIAPSRRVAAIQRALAEYGYGQLTPTGVYDPETRDAIAKFERDRRLPVTGQISDRVVRELSSMTGRPLD